MGAIKFPLPGWAHSETKTDLLLNSCSYCVLLLLQFYDYKPQPRLEWLRSSRLGYVLKILMPVLPIIITNEAKLLKVSRKNNH